MAPLVVLLLRMLSTVSFTFILSFGCDGAGRARRPTVSLCCWLFGQAAPEIDLVFRCQIGLGGSCIRGWVEDSPALPIPVLIAMRMPLTGQPPMLANLIHPDAHGLDAGRKPVGELRAANGQRGGHAATSGSVTAAACLASYCMIPHASA